MCDMFQVHIRALNEDLVTCLTASHERDRIKWHNHTQSMRKKETEKEEEIEQLEKKNQELQGNQKMSTF